MRPTFEELLAINLQQHYLIIKLEKRIAELKERLNLNSSNTSKPLSSDQKKHKEPSRGAGKPGHSGHHRVELPESG